jgi:tungstate transport system substrate-binding protein
MNPLERCSLFWVATAFLVVALGCKQSTSPEKTLTLATTTSTQDSGLLDVLIPKFQEATGIEVKVVAVGSGQALELGRRGDADILLTHAPAAEQTFMAEGWGQEQRPVMHNDFIVVGPESDPAKIKGQPSAAAAFREITHHKSGFVSRGDDSGTHQKERQIWESAGLEPHGEWYIRAGAGMAEALRLANEKQAYTLADRGTFLALQADFELEILLQGDAILKNHYSLIIPSAKKHPHLNLEAAKKFADFLTAPKTKKSIGAFGVDRFGEPLFFPEGN